MKKIFTYLYPFLNDGQMQEGFDYAKNNGYAGDYLQFVKDLQDGN